MSYVFRGEVGQTFNRWKIIDSNPVPQGLNGLLHVNCQCQCGTTRLVSYDALRSGNSKSCGCLAVERSREGKTHGMYKHPIMSSYRHMMGRCTNPNTTHAHRYIGRGIDVCERWKGHPENFIEDMQPAWFKGATLERIDNDLGYSPGNCKWATRKEQSLNRSTCRYITYNGETMTVSDWERHLGWNRNTLATRLERGYSIEEALSKPVKTKNRDYKSAAKIEAALVDLTQTGD